MKNDDQKKRPPRFLLAMPDDTRLAIERAAFVAGRTVTAEINQRLKASLRADTAPDNYPAGPLTTGIAVVHDSGPGTHKDKSPADPLSETDRAMLAVFRRLPVDKQLALLSLFK